MTQKRSSADAIFIFVCPQCGEDNETYFLDADRAHGHAWECGACGWFWEDE